MRNVFLLITLAGLLLGSAPVMAGADGYAETIRWWSQIETAGARVDAELRRLYEEAGQGRSAEQQARVVDRLLKEHYPGGSFAAGRHGRLVFGPNNTAEFSGCRAQTLVARMDDTVRRYDLQKRRFTILHRSHSLSAEIRPASPAGSRFVDPAVLPPWLDEEAGRILGRKGTVFSSSFVELLNEVYARRLAGSGLRLDQLAEQVLTDGETGEQIMALGRELHGPRP